MLPVRLPHIRLEEGISALALIAALLLGGGTRGGFLSDAILQLLSVVLLAVLLLWPAASEQADTDPARARLGRRRKSRFIAVACTLIFGVVAYQLVPLPASIWSALPGRELVVDGLRTTGLETTWRSSSVDPSATWLALLSLLPAFLVLVAVSRLGYAERRRMSALIIAVGLISVVVGMLQVAQGEGSRLRFFDITNKTEAVGFFANRNHFSALINVLILLVAAWMLDTAKIIAPRSGGRTADNWYAPQRLLPVLAGFLTVMILMAAQFTARSRAGLGITVIVLLAAVVLAFSDRELRAQGRRIGHVLAAAAAVSVLLALQYSIYRVLDRFGRDALEDARIAFARNTMTLARELMPVGGGAGSFVNLYAANEPLSDTLFGAFANHAHNDFLELWLEHGLFAWVLGAMFLAWLGVKGSAAWRSSDDALPRAAVLIVLAIAIHSAVDYPLRTSTMTVMLAFALALLLPPARVDVAAVHDDRRESGHREHRGRQRSASRRAPPAPAPEPAPAPAASAAPSVPPQPRAPGLQEREPTPRAPASGQRWGSAVEWPDAWRKPDESK